VRIVSPLVPLLALYTQVITTRCESRDIYHFCPSTQLSIVIESPSLLHAQLGHPSLAKLQQLLPSLSKLSILMCELCQLGKHSRSSFSSNVSQRASSLFVLVHSDIWEPSRIRYNLGFITFINDYSIYS